MEEGTTTALASELSKWVATLNRLLHEVCVCMERNHAWVPEAYKILLASWLYKECSVKIAYLSTAPILVGQSQRFCFVFVHVPTVSR